MKTTHLKSIVNCTSLQPQCCFYRVKQRNNRTIIERFPDVLASFDLPHTLFYTLLAFFHVTYLVSQMLPTITSWEFLATFVNLCPNYLTVTLSNRQICCVVSRPIT